MLSFFPTRHRHELRQHEVHYAFAVVFSDYGFINFYFAVKQFIVLLEESGQRLVIQREMILFTENPRLRRKYAVKLLAFQQTLFQFDIKD